MKISEVPIAQLEKEISTRFRSTKHIELLNRIKEMDGDFGFAIQCDDSKEVDRLQAVIYGFKRREGMDNLIINQSKTELKLFVRKVKQSPVKRGRPKKES